MSDNQPPEGFDPQQVSLKTGRAYDEPEVQGAVEVPDIMDDEEGAS